MGLQTRPIPNDTNTEYISVSTVQLYNMTKAVLLCQPVFNITKIFVVPSHSPFFFFFFFLLQSKPLARDRVVYLFISNGSVFN